jgi:beta-lactam-binding protein with PASTA domain
MANIFLSYAREDSVKARIIAQALSAREWTVWWDRTIPPGKTFDDVIEDALDRAACVVVLWSKASVASHWVRAEAAEGARRGILVPALLEATKIPLEFRRVQAADLTSWIDNPADPEFERFLQSIATLIQPAAVGSPRILSSQVAAAPAFDLFEGSSRTDVPKQLYPQRRRSHGIGWVATTLLVVAVLAGGLAWWWTTRAPLPPVTEQPLDQARTLPPQSSVAPGLTRDARVDVPSIVGLQLDEARARLERIGLRVGGVREANESGPDGAITAQRPGAGDRVSLGAVVDLVVARSSTAKAETTSRVQPDPKTENRVAPGIEVPALTGLSIDEARDRVARRGLTVGSVTARANDRMPANTVLSQDPAAGTRQASGTPISVVVAEAPRIEQPPQIPVPELIGLAERDAADVLMRARLKLGQITRRATSASEPGKVLAQRIRPSTLVPSGTSIDIQVADAPSNRSGARRGRSSFPNSITNIRAIEKSPSEVTFEADVFYDGASGADQIYLTVTAMDGKSQMRGTVVPSRLRVGASRPSVTLRLSDTVAEATSTDVNLCIRVLRPPPAARTEPLHCQTFPLVRKWVLPKNTVTTFRGRDVSTSELRINVSIWYDGRFGPSDISLLACAGGGDARMLAREIRCGQAPLKVGPNNVELAMAMGGDAQMLESSQVRVCLVGPRDSRDTECQVFPHQKRWSR